MQTMRKGPLCRAVLLAFLLLTPGGGKLGAQSPPPTRSKKQRLLNVVGTAHLDTQWRWTIQNTIEEFVPNTFRDNFKLMDIFPEYVFSFEGAFRYMLLKEYYPQDFRRLRHYIASGQWRVAGSWVDAVDVNIPAFESLVRHCLYGNGFFKRELGVSSRDIFLPDCFGFGYALPAIAAHCGLKSFSTQKLTWGSSVGVPFDIGLWEGVDGSTLLAALNPGDYVTQIRSDLSRDTTWLKKIDHQGDTSSLSAGYMYFGTGDVGGAPDSESVGWLDKSMKSDGPITVRSTGSDELVDLVAAVDQKALPRFKGELLMTRHGVGCYTSQAAMKRWNRKNELLANAAERASVVANQIAALEYPGQGLRDTWVRFLWHQFHDDITGTSIPQAYQFSWNDEVLCQNRFAGILENAVEATTPHLDTRVAGVPLVVFNPLAIDREDPVEATVIFSRGAPNAVRVLNAAGKEVPSQITHRYSDSLTVLFLARVPSVGYAVFDVRPEMKSLNPQVKLKISNEILENERYRVQVDRNGDISSIFDKLLSRELLTAPIQWQLLFDKPKRWPAWEIGYDDIMAKPRAVLGMPAEIKIVEAGPARVGLEVRRQTDQSKFRTVIRLTSGSAGNRIEFDSEVDWYERETLLKAVFPLASANDSVTYDLGLGAIKRGINREKLYEVPGHQWADMTSANADFGVAILNDCKYGWDHPEKGTLRLTLIHTPSVYDAWSWVGDQRSQDNGHHQFTFALCGHAGGPSAEIPWQAARLNQPLLAFQTTKHQGALGPAFSFVKVKAGDPKQKSDKGEAVPHVFVNALKRAEDTGEIIVRLRELCGTSITNVPIHFARPVLKAREVNGAEESAGGATIRRGDLVVSLGPYQPKAYALTLGPQKLKLSARSYQPLALPYNLDGISTDDNRLAGDFDGKGNSLAGELLPDTLMYSGVPFVFGSKTAAALNGVSCRTQNLSLPGGPNDRLYLIAAAVGGPALGTFAIDGNQREIWIQDWAEPIAQWNNRLVAGRLVEEPGEIAPAYINRQPVAWYGTHRHNARGENEAYRFTYLFLIRLDLPAGARSVTLPSNPQIKLLAATAANTGYDQIRSGQPLYDYTNATLAKIAADSVNFIAQAKVSLSTPISGARIHYSLDGSDPDTLSPVYRRPFTIAATTTVKARAILAGSADGYVTTAKYTKLSLREAVSVGKLLPGLRCSYYEGSWSRIPRFDTLTARVDTVLEAINIPTFARKEDYGLVLTGILSVPKDGMYEFSISSDDGSQLFIADSLVVDNDGLHGAGEVSGQIALKAGYHAIKVLMFQAKGDQELSAAYQGPGVQKQRISPGILFHEVGGRR